VRKDENAKNKPLKVNDRCQFCKQSVQNMKIRKGGQEKKLDDARDIRYQMIDNRSELAGLIQILENEKIIGVDVEADSMYHFKEKVCLIQMATTTLSAVIDPLKVPDLSALKPIFKRRDIQKVLHGADYDIRSLYRDFQITITNLFDTELACRFLGFKETGLEAVLKIKFGVRLDKRFQRRDWSKRPLPEDMIAYAAEDVRFLIPLAERLQSDLQAKSRLAWVLEECEVLSGVRPNNTASKPLFLNFKGAGKLDPRSLAVLEALLQYRLRIARKKDKPLFRVISSGALMDLSCQKPLNLKQLEKSRALSPKQITMYGQDLIAAINGAIKLPNDLLPLYARKKMPRVPLTAAERVKALRHWRDIQAKKLKLDPALICPKSLISAIALQKPTTVSALANIKEIKKWQLEEFGDAIVKVLARVH
jgi:ribonuclease D